MALASLAAASGAVVVLAARAPAAGASGAAPLPMTLASTSPTAVVGGTVTLDAVVTGPTTGSFTFYEDGVQRPCSGDSVPPLAQSKVGVACTVSSLPGPAGVQSFTAYFFSPSSATSPTASASVDVEVEGAATSTTLSAPVVAVGATTTYTASVTASGAPAAGGSVTFSDDGAPLAHCTAVPVTTGAASCPSPAFASVGTHDIEAAYSGTDSLAPSAAAAVEAVGASASGLTATATRLTASSTDPPVGASVALGAVVTSSTSPAVAPTGTVTFTDGGTALPGCSDLPAAPAAGSAQAGATCPLPSGLASAGPHELQALFLPSARSQLSGSASSAVAVDAHASTAAVTVTATPDPAPGGEPVVIDVSVGADTAGGPASGDVQVEVDGAPASCKGTPSGTLTLAVGGASSCELTSLATGTSLVAATYLGSATLQAATAIAPVTVEPALATSSVAVAAIPYPATVGAKVTFTATVTSAGSSTPGGVVTFASNGKDLAGCTDVQLVGGAASCPVGPGYASTGTEVVSATYGGDSQHLPGAGALSEVVGPVTGSAPGFVLTGPETPVAIGSSVTYLATLSGASAPSGTVAFTDDGLPIAGCSAVSPTSLGPASNSYQATCALPSGYSTDLSHTIVASYSGDPSYAPASAALFTSVAHSSPVLDVIADPSPTVLGSTLQVGVSASGEVGTPTGSVGFSRSSSAAACQNGTPQVPLSAGVATCRMSAGVTGSTVSLGASYSGDDSYAPSVAAFGDETTATGAAPATVTLTAPPASAGTDVRDEVRVTGGSGAPTGTVQLLDGGTPVSACGTDGTLSLSSGSATCDVGSSLAVGVHALSARYSGDATYAPAATLVEQAVTPASPTVGGSGGGPGGSSPGGSGSPAGVSSPPASAPQATSTSIPSPGTTSPKGHGTTGTKARPPVRRTKPLSLDLVVPPTAPRGRPVVYRLRLDGRKGPLAGTVTFRIDGRAVRGCTRVALHGARRLQVTCRLAGGFAAAGYRVVTADYSGGGGYRGARARALEQIVPRWVGGWLVSRSGRLEPAGRAPALASRRLRHPVVAVAMAPDARGLWLLARDGAVEALGAARAHGSPRPGHGPFVAIAPTRDGRGYWLLTARGAVLHFGDARGLGGARASAATGPFVALAATPDGRGYWLLSARGVVVARGDARTEAPLGGGAPAPGGRFVAIAPTADGKGYTLLTSAGQLAAYGDAPPAPSRSVAGGAVAGGFVGLLRPAGHGGLWLATRDGTVVRVDHPPPAAPRPHRPPGPYVAMAGT